MIAPATTRVPTAMAPVSSPVMAPFAMVKQPASNRKAALPLTFYWRVPNNP
jgi:hypothetical protein